MRYFDEQLIANSRHHAEWWEVQCVNREWFHQTEDTFARLHNSAAILPRDAWIELDGITRRVMRNDEGSVFMQDLMALAKTVHIGKLIHMYRVSSDAGSVVRSISGQVPVSLDKVIYDYRGTPVPIFATAYGREWREWNTLQAENFDALADDQEAHTAKIRRDMALYTLNGDSTIVVNGITGMGLLNHTYSTAVNLGSATGGANIDLTSNATTADAIYNFFSSYLGAILDTHLVTRPVNIYVSPEIGRRLDLPYSGSAGFKEGTVLEHLLKNRRIAKIAVTYELSGNALFGFVPSSEYVRPLIGMAVTTTPMARLNPTDNYQFLIMGAMGIEVKADYNGKSGVFHSVVQN
jgi:hypothetical protein